MLGGVDTGRTWTYHRRGVGGGGGGGGEVYNQLSMVFKIRT